MSATRSPTTGRHYPLTQVCAVYRVPRTTAAPASPGAKRGPKTPVFGVKYFCRSTSIILAGSDGCSFDDAPFGGRCCGF